jgi:hypothetical protein
VTEKEATKVVKKEKETKEATTATRKRLVSLKNKMMAATQTKKRNEKVDWIDCKLGMGFLDQTTIPPDINYLVSR